MYYVTYKCFEINLLPVFSIVSILYCRCKHPNYAHSYEVSTHLIFDHNLFTQCHFKRQQIGVTRQISMLAFEGFAICEVEWKTPLG